ncbi:MAG: NAD(P)/FAD-dependent oxidoreductase, partial [Bacteroidales bacterium]|nr:NAD(P)/FAD-dependent oxidoreductase [Bacteroidales bacterium]
GFMMCNPSILQGRKGNERIDLDTLTKVLKGWEFPVDGYVGYERCVITAGGVSLDEVLSKSMESRLQESLYICGELLDVDCDTGGYNLQVAFCTGFMAGQSAAKAVLSDSQE